jgi:hypothetical protein
VCHHVNLTRPRMRVMKPAPTSNNSELGVLGSGRLDQVPRFSLTPSSRTRLCPFIYRVQPSDYMSWPSPALPLPHAIRPGRPDAPDIQGESTIRKTDTATTSLMNKAIRLQLQQGGRGRRCGWATPKTREKPAGELYVPWMESLFGSGPCWEWLAREGLAGVRLDGSTPAVRHGGRRSF